MGSKTTPPCCCLLLQPPTKTTETYPSDEGIQHHYSASYNPQQNGIVERHNQTAVGMARALLKQRGMSAVF